MPRASRQAREATALPEPGPPTAQVAQAPGTGCRSRSIRATARACAAARVRRPAPCPHCWWWHCSGCLLARRRPAAFRNGFLNIHQMWVAFVGDPAKGILSVGKGFVLNLWLSVVCEAIVLVLALGVASLRLTRGPVLLPFRALAIAYTDFARGVPVILIMLWVGFGVPSLNLDKVSSQSPVVYAGFVLVFSYTAYVAEVYRAGLMSVPRAQVQAARSLGLSSRTTLVAGRAPPGGAQRFAGAVERLRFAAEGHRHRLDAWGGRGSPCRSDRRGRRVQLLRLHDRVLTLPRRHRATHPLHGPHNGTGQVSPAGRHNGVSARRGRRPPRAVERAADLVLRAVVCTSPSARSRCCEASTFDYRSRGGVPHRFVGVREVDPAALLQSSRAGRLRDDRAVWPRPGGRAHRRGPRPAPHGDGVPVVQPVPALERARQRHPRTAARPQARPSPGRAARPGAAQPDRPGGQGVRVPRPSVREASSSASRSSGRSR